MIACPAEGFRPMAGRLVDEDVGSSPGPVAERLRWRVGRAGVWSKADRG